MKLLKKRIVLFMKIRKNKSQLHDYDLKVIDYSAVSKKGRYFRK